MSKAKYIVEQYVAASGGEPALSAAASMYAVGKVLMRTTKGQKLAKTGMGVVHGGGEIAGGFVVWQKRPEMWCVEMVVAGGTKMSAGSDGKVAWCQTPWQQAHASRGPPRPLRRCVQVSINCIFFSGILHRNHKFIILAIKCRVMYRGFNTHCAQKIRVQLERASMCLFSLPRLRVHGN